MFDINHESTFIHTHTHTLSLSLSLSLALFLTISLSPIHTHFILLIPIKKKTFFHVVEAHHRITENTL